MPHATIAFLLLHWKPFNRLRRAADEAMKSLPLAVAVLLLVASLPVFAQAPLTPPQQDYVLHFNGAQIAESSGPNVPVLGSEFTIEGWIWLDRADPHAFLFGTLDTAGTGNWYQWNAIRLTDDMKRIAFVQSSGSGATEVIAPSDLTLRTWVHAAGTLKSGTASLYINGVLAGSNSSNGPPPAGSVPFALGGLRASFGVFNGFVGALRQVRVWNRALSAQELTAQATRSLSGSEPGLLGCWPLDDGAGLTPRDLSTRSASLRMPPTESGDQSNAPAWWLIGAGGPFYQLEKISYPPSILSAFAPYLPPIVEFFPIDFNSDGHVDILASTTDFFNFDPFPVYAFRNDGYGNLVESTADVLGSLKMQGATRFVVMDFDGDGRSDIFIAESGPDRLPAEGGQSRLLMQTPDGRLVDETASRLPIANNFTHDVAAADVNGDGHPDILMSNIARGTNRTQLLMNDGAGHFAPRPESLPVDLRSSDYQGYPSAIFGDFRKRGFPDLVLGTPGLDHSPYNPTLYPVLDRFLLNDGTGNFSSASDGALPLHHWLYPLSASSVRSATADFDGDGWPDILFSETRDYQETFLRLLLNNHDGTFREASERIPQSWRVGPSYGSGWIEWIVPTDMNGDGWIDFVATGKSGFHLYLNDGGTRFVDASALVPVGLEPWIGQPVRLGNGPNPDLLFMGWAGGDYYIARNLKAFTGVMPTPPAYAGRRRAAAHR